MLIDGFTLDVAALTRLARDPARTRVTLDPQAAGRMKASADLKDRLVDEGAVIYGVTTGFGDSAHRRVSAGRASALQDGLIQFLLTGAGSRCPDEVVRAMIAIRANCLARGVSAARPEVAELLVALLEHDLLPEVPERGSVGASGDLVPSSYLAAALVGEGQVRLRGRTVPAAEALHARGLEPLVLRAKEGLALVNGTSFMTAYAALAVHDAHRLAFAAEVCTALASQALGGNAHHFAAFLGEHKPHPGQVRSASHIHQFLAGSALTGVSAIEDRIGSATAERRIQDRYSVRCAPQVIGVLHDTLAWVEPWVEREINSANDNPLFDTASGEVFSGGNFYGGHIAQAMDSLKVAVAGITDLLDRQLAQVVDEKLSGGLPSNLVPEGGTAHGYKGMQIACSSFAAEALKQAAPATVFSRSTEAHNQDKVSMGSIAARDSRTVVELTAHVTAVVLHALCQAVELRGVDRLSPATKEVWKLVREHVAFLDADRPLDQELDALAGVILSGELEATCHQQTPPDRIDVETADGTRRTVR
ncbi:aromatic amino acid ammonia-lyase [Myceligenerans pegani]|uniref:HAL/PAL/TAL family ammonia-lyase n=1 Tax=Myceligenerans pegani TaxID=2776917 RepID=UPI00299DBAE1|nr:aromatic amino acid ammonia-lyase [Myceligenerans sp. TRM 65318]